MGSTTSTPTVDALRQRGVWGPAMDDFAQWDPDWTERCARMTNNPWTTGVLPVKWVELICIALNAACTYHSEPGVRRHIRAALDAGATGEEIRETLKGVSVLGIHSVAVTLPILLEEAETAGVQPAPRPAGGMASEMTSCTPARPRDFSERRNAVQNAPSSLSPTSNPSTSRCPSAATPVATTTAWETTRWFTRALQ